MRKLLAVLALGVAATASWGQGTSKGIAFERASHLKHGINLSMWYAQAGDYSAERLATYTTVQDIHLIKSLGFDHARLSINPEPLMLNGRPDAFDPAAIARLDKTVSEITATGLVVILDIHPEMPYVEALGQGDDAPAKFLAFWKTFATHFAKTNPKQVYFEVLNEPHDIDSARWAEIQSRAVAEIRAIAPSHTIIATGSKWGGVQGLLELSPVADHDVIYSFHDYDPMTFTHQGATWSTPYLKPLRGVPYPSTPENIAPLLALEPDEDGKKQLAQYGAERWDAARVDKEIASMAAWGAQHRSPVWCGEFGVYETYAQPQARAAWLHDMRVAFEAHHIGWSMWDYQGGFALVTKADGTTTVDKSVAGALGLKAR